ncbi:MAG: hypothetical protein ACK5PW_02795 [Burkholderiales bacterium]|jgi:hypothetical protein
MIRRPVLAAAAAVIALGLPALAHAEVPALAVIGGTSFTLNPMNDFYAGGAATAGGRLSLTAPAEVTFRLVNAEASINNAFEYRGAALFSNADLGSATSRTFVAGSGLLDFAFRMPSTNPALTLLTNSGNGLSNMPSFAVTMLGNGRARLLLDDHGGAGSGFAAMDDDYDDMVLDVSIAAVTPVPEAGELLIMSVGLAFAAGVARRRKARRA